MTDTNSILERVKESFSDAVLDSKLFRDEITINIEKDAKEYEILE